jgi:hypothetical protein
LFSASARRDSHERQTRHEPYEPQPSHPPIVYSTIPSSIIVDAGTRLLYITVWLGHYCRHVALLSNPP